GGVGGSVGMRASRALCLASTLLQRNAGLFDDAPIYGDLAAHVLGELLWNARRVVDVRFRGKADIECSDRVFPLLARSGHETSGEYSKDVTIPKYGISRQARCGP